MPITLPKLPYALDALEPHMSRETLQLHHGKHHKTYVDKTNTLIAGTELEHLKLDEIVQRATGETFNNAAQAWNHAFFWRCLTPEQPPVVPELREALESNFGDVDAFEKKFAEQAVKVFGSGWAWLVMDDDGKLEIVTTRNGDTPLTEGQLPLLTCDLWEHAYYLDYRNDRLQYVQQFFPLVNWEFVAQNLSTAMPAAARPGKRRAEHRSSAR